MRKSEMEELVWKIGGALVKLTDVVDSIADQHKTLIESLKLAAISLNNLQDRMASMEKFNAIEKTREET